VFGIPGVGDQQVPAVRFTPGQHVWIDGREATFCYLISAGAAVIRYEGHTATCVVPTHKLAALLPSPHTTD
jgi:hypothetical protein